MSLSELDIEALVERKVQEHLQSIVTDRRSGAFNVSKALHEYINERFQDSGLRVLGWREHMQREAVWNVLKLAYGKRVHDMWSTEHLEAGKRIIDQSIEWLLSMRSEFGE